MMSVRARKYLQRTSRERIMAHGFVNSTEYRLRFGQPWKDM